MKREPLITEIRNFQEIRRYIVDVMRDNKVEKRKIAETLLVFEALYNDLLEQGVDPDITIKIRGSKNFGDLTLTFGYTGAQYIPEGDDGDGSLADMAVMKAYADKIERSYHGGYNYLSIKVTRGYNRFLMQCLIGLGAAVLTYLLMEHVIGNKASTVVLDSLVFPLEKVFTNAMLMVGTPLTFCALLRNLTDAYIVSEKDSHSRRLQMGALRTSVVSVILAMITGILLAHSVVGYPLQVSKVLTGKQSLAEWITSSVPSSIFAPFDSMSPIPLIFLALLTAYALCHVGNYFDPMKKVVDALYTLLGRMLTVVMFTLPFFCAVALLDVLICEGIGYLLTYLVFILTMIMSSLVIALVYIVRLFIRGASIKDFFRHLPGFLRENLIINSAIEAAPFNIRYCTVKYGMNKKRLEESLPILAEINLDGNCFVIMMASIFIIAINGTQVSVIDLFVIAALVVTLSMGAPNQPGSMLIGTLIIINYIHAYDLLCTAIIAEVFLGRVLNLINVTGDLVIVYSEEAHLKRSQERSPSLQ